MTIKGLLKLKYCFKTSELIVAMIVSVIIGITIALLFNWGCGETIITDHEVLIGNFLDHEELMVVRKVQ